MHFNFDLVVNSFPLLLVGAGVTIKITALSVALGVVIGLFVGIARISRIKLLRVLAAIYVDFFRGTPLLVQIFLVYFALPVITGQRVDPFVAAIGSCGINSGAYVAEIFRAGIQAIPAGQYEAAHTLGMNYVQTMRRIILPQVIRIILPPISNETITLVKDTSLVYVLAMNDLMRTARNLVQRDFSITPFIVAAVFYLLATLILTLVFERLEKRFSRYDQ